MTVIQLYNSINYQRVILTLTFADFKKPILLEFSWTIYSRVSNLCMFKYFYRKCVIGTFDTWYGTHTSNTFFNYNASNCNKAEIVTDKIAIFWF